MKWNLVATGRRWGALVPAAAALFFAACAQHAAYAPGGTVAGNSGYLTAQYAIPPNGGQGNLYVTSFGGKTMPAHAGNPAGEYLQVRLALSNDKDAQPWTLDPREQYAEWGGQQVAPAFADTSAGPGRAVTVAAGQRGFVDVYYPLPPQADPDSVQIAWRVRRGTDEVANRATFNRVAGRDQPVYVYQPYGYANPRVYVGLGVGPGWWWGPRPWWAATWDWPYYYGGWGYGYGYYRPYSYWGPSYYHSRGYYGGYGHSGGYGGGSGGIRAAPSGGGGWRGGGGAPSGGGGGGVRSGGGGWRR